MTYDELKSRIDKAVSDPDSVQANIGEIMNDIQKDYETMNSMTEKITQQDEKIRTLQDTNTRLYLQISGNGEEDNPPEPEPEGEAAIDKFFEDILKEDEDNA